MASALKRMVRMMTFPELAQGLSVTLKWLLKGKVTECYPDQRPVLPYRTKGRLHVDIDTCISCRMCEKACPEGCIKVFAPPREVMKTDKRPVQFFISIEHCLHCGMCVDVCPTGSIHHSQEFEMASCKRGDYLFDKETLPFDLEVKHFRQGLLESVVDRRDRKR